MRVILTAEYGAFLHAVISPGWRSFAKGHPHTTPPPQRRRPNENPAWLFEFDNVPLARLSLWRRRLSQHALPSQTSHKSRKKPLFSHFPRAFNNFHRKSLLHAATYPARRALPGITLNAEESNPK